MPVVQLLGTAAVRVDWESDVWQGHLGLGKPLVLLARLATEPRGFTREALADFLWPGIPRHNSRASLRQALHVIRRAVGGEALLEGRGRVAITSQLDSDWARLQAAAGRKDDPAVLTLYRGAFLEDLPVLDVLDADQWVEGERTRLARLVGRSTYREVQRLLAGGAPDEALAKARRLQALVPADSTSWALLLDTLSHLGDRTGLAEMAEAMAVRLAGRGFSDPDRAREVLDQFQSLDTSNRTPPVLDARLSAEARASHPQAGGAAPAASFVVVYRASSFPEGGSTAELLIRPGESGQRSVVGSSLIAAMLHAFGAPYPMMADQESEALCAAFEGLSNMPYRLRLVGCTLADGPALQAIRSAASVSRGTCLLIEAEVDPTVADTLRSWRSLFDWPERIRLTA